MDPNACLAMIDRFLRREDTGPEVDEWCKNLSDWLTNGGFAPDWEQCPLGASYYDTRTVSQGHFPRRGAKQSRLKALGPEQWRAFQDMDADALEWLMNSEDNADQWWALTFENPDGSWNEWGEYMSLHAACRGFARIAAKMGLNAADNQRILLLDLRMARHFYNEGGES